RRDRAPADGRRSRHRHRRRGARTAGPDWRLPDLLDRKRDSAVFGLGALRLRSAPAELPTSPYAPGSAPAGARALPKLASRHRLAAPKSGWGLPARQALGGSDRADCATDRGYRGVTCEIGSFSARKMSDLSGNKSNRIRYRPVLSPTALARHGIMTMWRKSVQAASGAATAARASRNFSRSSGFTNRPSMPAARQASRSSVWALAVSASMRTSRSPAA